jgi:hypothetical protein
VWCPLLPVSRRWTEAVNLDASASAGQMLLVVFAAKPPGGTNDVTFPGG